jgi:hypothetical protein
MAQAFDGTPSNLEQLSERLRALERRVAALESQPQKPSAAALESPNAAPSEPLSQIERREFVPAGMAGGIVPTVGKAVLGFAGAYLLRAIAEWGIIPKGPVLAVAVAYAGLWMVWAIKTDRVNRFAGVTYAVTSALILSPLLWESTVRLHILSPALSATLLVAFVALAIGLAWPHNLQLIPWLATFAGVTTALALIIATQALVPLTAALLAVALASELAACLGHTFSARVVAAVAADFAVWLLIDIMASAKGVPSGYHPASPTTIISLCLSLLVIYVGSTGLRTLGSRHGITILETIQGTLAVVLATFGVLRASHGSAALALGLLLFMFAALCYWGALSRFADAAHTRNRRVYGTWGAALLIAGSSLLLSLKFRVPFLCLVAILAVWAYRHTGKLSLGLHGSFYLAAAAALSPLLRYAGNALARTVEAAPDWNVWIVALAAFLCYGIGTQEAGGRTNRRLLWVVPVMLVGLTVAALAVVAIAGLAGHSGLSAALLSVVRTLVICALALIFGFLRARSNRLELGWVAYTAVAFGTLKLLFEDLRFGNPTSLVASLLFYGLILILLPRLMRRSRTEA